MRAHRFGEFAHLQGAGARGPPANALDVGRTISSRSFLGKAHSRLGFLLFAETLRAWVGQLEDGTEDSRRVALIRAVSPTFARSAPTPPPGSNRWSRCSMSFLARNVSADTTSGAREGRSAQRHGPPSAAVNTKPSRLARGTVPGRVAHPGCQGCRHRASRRPAASSWTAAPGRVRRGAIDLGAALSPVAALSEQRRQQCGLGPNE
jgi:hypothetical protein